MIAFPEMLVGPARQAGITVPDNVEDYDKEQFPHWIVYLTAQQLGTGLPCPAAQFDNARVIAAIPEDRIRKTTMADLIALGFRAIV